MNPRRTQEQIGLFPVTFPAVGAVDVDLLRAQAAQTRDAAIGAHLRRAAKAVWQVLAAIGTALLTFPQRHETYESLRSLSDRELADIGLNRGDIGRVFEPGFQLPGRAANANEAQIVRGHAA